MAPDRMLRAFAEKFIRENENRKKEEPSATRLRVEALDLVKTSGLEPPTPCMSSTRYRCFLLRYTTYSTFCSEKTCL